LGSKRTGRGATIAINVDTSMRDFQTIEGCFGVAKRTPGVGLTVPRTDGLWPHGPNRGHFALTEDGLYIPEDKYRE
jgi:hypothetical protein